MEEQNRSSFVSGMRVGIPIGLGYFAVAFTLGIAAKRAGLTAFQAALASLLTNASAGQYAGFTVIAESGTYFQMAIMILVANARYLLMSCALSQKLPTDTPMFHRFWTGFFITDEIFGVSSSREGKLNPFYTYGTASIAVPGWALGTCLGVILGTALPPRITRALSVALYGMFLAVIIPPARKNRVIAVLVIASMLASSLFSYLPLLSGISSGMRVIILTVILSGLAAVLFPIKEDSEDAE